MFFFSPRKSRLVPPSRRRPPTFRPRLEALENRCLLTAGALDPSFGSGGIVSTSALYSLWSGPDSVAIEPDGKVLTIAVVNNHSGTQSAAVMRFNTNGSVDTSFGNGGTATAQLSSKVSSSPAGVALQSDGKILLAATNLLARFNTNCSLDTTFGSGGMVQTLFVPSALAIQSDGKLDVAGEASDGSGAIARYNVNGSLDSSFGAGGEVTLSADGFVGFNGLAIQGDGKIVAVGPANPPAGQAFGVVRYTSNGTLDSTFASGGIALTALAAGVPDRATAVAIQSDGKIVVEGTTHQPSGATVFGLVRYNVGVAGQSDGSLDSTFGQGGIVTTLFPGSGVDADSMALQADGKIIVVGSNGGGAFALARYNVGVAGQADGSLDNTFGDGGILLTTSGGAMHAQGVAFYPSNDPTNGGKMVVEGQSNNGTGNGGVMLARYLVAPSASLSVSGFPSSVSAGSAGTFTVTAQNADGSTNTNYTGAVHFTCSDPRAALPADYTFTAADQGVHTFSATLVTGINLTGPSSGSQFIVATDTANSATFGGEASITVNPLAATSFLVRGSTSPTQGMAASYQIYALDPYGNIATGYIGTVTFSSSDPLASLPGNYTFTAADVGSHVFSGVTFNSVGTESLTVTDTLNSSINGTESGISVQGVQKKHGH
jgi:uncharacterized delta-60 repeat protein